MYFQFAAHPVDERNAVIWTDNDVYELAVYFGHKHLIVCPNCELLLGDVAEVQRDHRNAGAFEINKKELFKQCKSFPSFKSWHDNYYPVFFVSVFKDVTKYSNGGWQKMIENPRLLKRFRKIQLANGEC